MPRALPLVATLIAVGSAWSAEPTPVRPLDWKPILPAGTTTTPAVAPTPDTTKTPIATKAPVAIVETPVTAMQDVASLADASRFMPFNGVAVYPMIISTVDHETTGALAWNLDFSFLHNRVTALMRGLPESDAYRVVRKDQFDFDFQIEGFGKIATTQKYNPVDHQSARLVACVGYGFVGASGAANAFSDDASNIYFDAAVTGGMEAVQDLSSNQFVAGVRLITTPSVNAELANYNFFDWIPRLGRFVSGDDWSGNGSGRALPVIAIDVEQVSASNNDLREIVAPNDDSYMRVHVGVSGRAPIWHLPHSDQYLYAFAAIDVYQELSAPTTVTDAGLDFIDHYTLGVELPNNMYASINTGELPMDPASKHLVYWTLGWKLVL